MWNSPPDAAASGLLGMAGGSGEIEPSRTCGIRSFSHTPIPDRLLVRRIYADCFVHNLGLFSQEKAEVEMTLSQSLGPLLGKEVSS